METVRPEYEFLDLSDVKDAELSSLKCALFERPAQQPPARLSRAWPEPVHDLSSCSSSTAGAPTVSSSLDSLSGGECEMAPHSPQRSGAAQPPAPVSHMPPPPPPPYVQPPPPYAHPPPHQQWPVVPPNVYVSQVTANVNVHGYMGQYYQPPQSQYVPPPQPTDRQPRGQHRRDRRGKRGPSPPPQQPPPYYVPYHPQYYPAAQAQGAPLYHVPMYQPVTYVGSYPYAPYYPEYPMPVDDSEKGPDEQYPQEMMMEQEAVDAYFAGTHYAPGPGFIPQGDGPMEYAPQVYLPPPAHHQPMHLPHPPPHYQPTQHHLNVHAKNFIQNHSKAFTAPEAKQQEQKSPVTNVPVASVSAAAVDALPVKDLKIVTKEPGSPKTDKPAETPQAKTSPIAAIDKSPPKTQTEAPKPVQVVTETKPEPQPQAVKAFPTTGPPASQPIVSNKVAPSSNKVSKGPAAPFSGGKQIPKTTPIPQAAIPTQQPLPTPKAPFTSRQRREGPATRSPDATTETTERATPAVEHPKREPPLPPSKAPMPISISLSSQGGAPLIVSNKIPFAHSRKSSVAPEPPPAPQPPPPAPTASDFPPPPTPRNRGEPAPALAPVQQSSAPQGKSWASLFSANKSPLGSSSSVCMPTQPIMLPTDEIPQASVASTASSAPNIQKPIAKVPPYDASLQQNVVPDKNVLPTRPIAMATPVISYSEKTSANTATATVTPTPVKAAAPVQSAVQAVQVEAKEATNGTQAKETTPSTPMQPSPFADDPNSYRMGEFLSKYQLDNRTVSLLPRGLTNRSNFCYVNAILQALIACAPFYNMLKALPYQTRRGKSSTPVIDAMVELCYEFTPLASNGRVSRSRGSEGAAASTAALPIQTGPPLDPAAGQKVLRALRPFAGSQEGRQEDAEEFLGCLLNGLNDEMLELMKLVEPEESKEAAANGVPVPEPLLEEDDDDDEWKVMGPKNKGSVERSWGAGRTPLSDIFRGRTRCRLHRTTQHHHVTDAVQPFFTLQLDIERAGSVKDALELVAGRDQLEGVTAGGARVDAWQQLSIEQLPVVLLLHLKCFQLDSEGHTAKIVKNIDFPIDLKIDTKIMSSKLKYNTRQRSYKLYAVVYHEGVEAVKGHYLTDTLHGQAGWIRYDDSTVTLVSEAQVLKPKPPRMPYLLMYRRQDTLPAPPLQHRPAAKGD